MADFEVSIGADLGPALADLRALQQSGQITEKQFKTGSRGFYGMTKLEIDGKRYQVQIQIVEIGSKPGSS